MPMVTVSGVRLEYKRAAASRAGCPTIVLLHEGLGCVSMWKDFPAALAVATGCSVVTYSRRGYGASDPISGPRPASYMHDEALIVLPEVLDRLDIENPVLFGHSDGASIALIHAGGQHRVRGIIAEAPHVMVESISITSIAEARRAYATSDLRSRLAQYHADVDGAFRGWSDIWLSSEFQTWSIEEYLPLACCPILAIQGEDDEYGTMEQIDRIARDARDVTLLKLANCHHSPHREQPVSVITAVQEWLGALESKSA